MIKFITTRLYHFKCVRDVNNHPTFRWYNFRQAFYPLLLEPGFSISHSLQMWFMWGHQWIELRLLRLGLNIIFPSVGKAIWNWALRHEQWWHDAEHQNKDYHMIALNQDYREGWESGWDDEDHR